MSKTIEPSAAPTAPAPSEASPSPAVRLPSSPDEDENAGFDLGAWEAEEDKPPPEADLALALAAIEAQLAISNHAPIDTSADWEDFEAYLPEYASPLPADDAEARERLRLLLLRAVREGSLPDSAVEDISRAESGIDNEEAGAILRMVINDLGAETDERIEYVAAHESFEVFVDPEEAPHEEDAVSDALAFIDDLAARRNDPMRLYQREFQREALLTAEAEVTLARAMEDSVEKALDALASWPSGIARVLEAAGHVQSGAMPLRWMSSGSRDETEDLDGEFEASPVATPDAPSETADEPDDADSLAEPDTPLAADDLSDFLATAAQLRAHAAGTDRNSRPGNPMREALGSLRLTRSFLLELADSLGEIRSEPAASFLQAIASYRCARDRMVVANLKLAFSIAKKYLYSGQPLDDLAQEGNLGLLKAVDRFDWRRGFKFSTYATWWIKQQIGRFVADKGKTIRVPVHIHEKIQRIIWDAQTFERETGRPPTIEESATRLGLPARKVAVFVRAAFEPLPIHDLDVDKLIAADATDDFVASDPMDIVSGRQLVGCIDRLLGTFTLKEERVLRMRFGIGIQDAFTLEEIGLRFHVTRERIRQIEAKALRHLRHPSRLDRLLCELNGNPRSKRDEDDGIDEEAIKTDEAQSTEPAPARRAPAGNGHAALDKVLDQAREAGIPVEDDRQGGSGRIWVNITETPDNHSRKLIRKLLTLGFEFWPGKGYWR